MTINIARFYKREQWKLECEIVTPMFLGNAGQEAELRAAPFKGLLRYWWRVASGWQYSTPADLLKAEIEIFGSPDDTGGKSRVTVEVKPLTPMMPKTENFLTPGDIDHPECERTHRRTNPLNYLAGMGLIHFRNGIQRSYFTPEERFALTIIAGQSAVKHVQQALDMLSLFGSMGSRSRNGWGGFRFNNHQICTRFKVRNFTDAFDRDFPHCLGKDATDLLYWQTRAFHKDWRDCMKDLADIYVSLRAGNAKRNIPKIEIKTGGPPDRHVLGYPVTNHPIQQITRDGRVDRNHPENEWRKHWGNTGRHGSALRLIVRKEADGRHRGYFLHLPHLFSK